MFTGDSGNKQRKDEKMKITIIGCQGAYPDQNQATSGYLIETENVRVLLDCGCGVISQIQNYILLEELDAVVITHYHPDHCSDLGCLQYASMILMQFGKRKKPLAVWGPGENERLSYGEYCTGNSYLEEDVFQIGDLVFASQKNVHDILSYAIRVEDRKGSSLVYSGDTGYNEDLSKFAEGTELFLCECSLYNWQKGKTPGHMCAEETGMAAKNAKAKKLCLTHLPPYGNRQQLLEEVGHKYQGELVLASSGMIFRQ